MKILKRIGIALVALIALVFITAAFVKKDYAVERSIVINKPKDAVFAYIKPLKNQDYYSYWNMQDPAMKKEYNGTDGTVGFKYAWESNNKHVGKGEQEIASIKEGEQIDYNVHFIKPFEGKAQSYLTTEAPSEGITKVRWGMKSSMPYPMNIMQLFIDADKMLGSDIEKGLANLKTNLEKPQTAVSSL